jgi:hypothetical protein
MTRIHTALKKDGKGLNNVRYLGGAELTRLENKYRNDHRGWFVSLIDKSCMYSSFPIPELTDICLYGSRHVMKTRPPEDTIVPWSIV